MAGRVWYYADRGERRGPVGETEMAALVQSGAVAPQTLVWSEGMADWATAASALPDDLKAGRIPPAPPEAPPASRTPASAASAHAYEAGIANDHPTGFGEAVKACFGKYATFTGRSRRPEFWWFVLFNFIMNLVLTVVDIGLMGSTEIQPLSSLYALAVLLPSLAVGARRLHDVGRSAWWLLIWLVPIIGWIILIIWFAKPGDRGANAYGPG